MKIAHIADLHCCREQTDEALASLQFFAEQIKKSPVNMVCISGDTWDASMLNTEASGFNRFTDAIRNIADLAPTVMIYGTPSHDTDGSLEIFRKITCKYGITILEPGQAYFLVPGGNIFSEDKAKRHCNKNELQALIFGIPEPRKKYLLADNSTGKDETEETIREAMHKLCFLLGAKRNDYLDIPCVLLYHGDIAGSTLQNDQTIERGTGISITVDELTDTGADYIALGHIHKPQQVGNIPAYYAGSIYPKNFGETHKAGFNVVEFISGNPYGFPVKVDRVDFPHPQNIKIETSLDDWRENPTLDVTGKKVWLEITCKKEDRAFINVDSELQGLYQYGAVEGSRVTISELAIETVRAAEITEVNTPARKFEVWAQNSNQAVENTVIEKIKRLENEVMKSAASVSGEWELASLKLRGSIGIRKGLHKEEICLNLANYDNGLIALIGNNGRGKTTLIENCHPYPQMLTRKGKLQDHFCLRDSYREIIYEDRSLKWRGHFIKFLIQIDGQNKSGSCKYYIFDAHGFANLESVNEWKPRPGVDGNLKPYEEVVNGIFGSIDLFLRTAFSTQKPTKDLPDLADATAGEKKALFVALAGIDYLQRFADVADAKSKLEESKIHDGEIKKQMLLGVIYGKEQENQRLNQSKKLRLDAENKLADITEKGKIAKADMEKKQAAFNAEEIRTQKEIEARKAVEQVMAEIKTLNDDVIRYTEAAQNKSAYEKQITEYETLQKTVETENQKKQKVTETNMEKQQGYLKQKTEHDQKIKAVEVERDKAISLQNDIEKLIMLYENNIKLYERDSANIEENCPTCGQKLQEDKLAELKAKREQFVEKITKEKNAIKEQNNKLEVVKKRIADAKDELADLSLDEPTTVKLETFDESILRSATEKMRQIDIAQVRANLEKANAAKVRIEGLKNQLADKNKLLNERSNVVKELTKGIDDTTYARLRRELDDAISCHEDLTKQYTSTKEEIARQEANVEAIMRTLADIETKEKELAELVKSMNQSVKENNEWNTISRAFGKDGIQALELDALAPSISDTANKILESAYGDRFKIAIETTRIGGAGKKTKQIEDFVIKVIDSEDGESVNLENKSGGEAVWIKRAIYDAFAVIRKRNTNFAFLSCFQDEVDGALDSGSKTAYCRMLEAAHEASNLRHTIVITHSNEVKAMIEQKIDMDVLAVKEAA